jgi:hypothetical protein
MTRHRFAETERGNALIIAVLVVVAMVTLAAALMTTAAHESQESRAAGEQTKVLYVTEAGISHAIADLAAGGTGNLGSVSSPVEFGGGTYWSTTVDNGDGSFTVTSTGLATSEAGGIEVVILEKPSSPFTKGLFGDLDIGASGKVFTDSYDSDLGTYASQATNFHALSGLMYANANGDLASNGNIKLFGGVTILGDATPGPGGSVTITGGGVHVEGSTAPAAAASPVPPVEYDPPIASTGDVYLDAGTTPLASGTYRYSSLTMDGSAELRVKGDVVLYVDGDVDVSGGAQVTIETGASLRIQHGGETFYLAGNGVLNKSQIPANFKVFSKAEGVQVAGTSGLYGAIYAPDAVISPLGTPDVFGSLVGKEVYVGGTSSFHYDEALAKSGSTDGRRKFHIRSWRRIAPVTP